jgi:hypothetical protein
MQNHKPFRAKLKRPGNQLLKPASIKAWLAVTVWIFILLVPAVAGAATLLSQSFTADNSVTEGSIVSLQKGSNDHVTASTTANANYIFGVAVNGDNSELSISSGQSNQVHVADSGVEQVLVSDINGGISVGDPITASPINGVGMKATNNVKVIGVAQDNFPNSTASKQTFKDQSGKEQSAKIGEIPVLVNIFYYYKQPDKTLIPPAIQNLADALAGKKVNALPILISMGIFIVTLIVVVSIIYSMIRSSIISVGRNPMAQSSIYRNVIQLSVLVIVILGVAVGSMYLILSKF